MLSKVLHPDARFRKTSFFLLAAVLLLPSQRSTAANWAVSYLNDVLLDTSGVGFSIGEMSGVTYLGPAPVSGQHRFATAQDSSSDVAIFDVAFSATGSIASAQAVDRLTLSSSFDFEGIVNTGTSYFLSEENSPGVREYDFATGNELQSVTIPSVFTDNKRNNLGFESLARNASGTKMWTANEAALTVDGPTATTAQGTTVRLLELDVSGSSITAGSQFAYEVEPVHATGLSSISGLSELVSLPDGTLLALERSFAALADPDPTFLSSLYEIDFTGATDVSQPPLDDGFDGETFTPVGKELLWSGQAGGGSGQNLEGLTLGPQLPNGDWVLLGVVDDVDPFSSNTIVSLLLTSTTSTGGDADFDQDGDVDGADFLIWQRNFGTGTTLAQGDADNSGGVDDADLAIWETQFAAGAGQQPNLHTVPEPSSLMLTLLAAISALFATRTGQKSGSPSFLIQAIITVAHRCTGCLTT